MNAIARWRRETARRCAEARLLHRAGAWTAELVGPPPALRSGPLLGPALAELVAVPVAAVESAAPADVRRAVRRRPVAPGETTAVHAADLAAAARGPRRLAAREAPRRSRTARRAAGGTAVAARRSLGVPTLPGAAAARVGRPLDVPGATAGAARPLDVHSSPGGGSPRLAPASIPPPSARRASDAAAEPSPRGDGPGAGTAARVAERAGLSAGPAQRWRQRRSARAAARLELGGARDRGRAAAPDPLLAAIEEGWRIDVRGPAAPARLLRALAPGEAHHVASGTPADPTTAGSQPVTAASGSAPPRPADAAVTTPARGTRRATARRMPGVRPAPGHDHAAPGPPPSSAPNGHLRPHPPDGGAPEVTPHRASGAAPSPPEDDFVLTDRIARILAEEARRHGIDV